MQKPRAELKVEVHPLTPQRWPDFEKLFGKKGACAGCWCMWWRLPAATWRARKGEGNRQAMRTLAKAGARPGLLAYADGQAGRSSAARSGHRGPPESAGATIPPLIAAQRTLSGYSGHGSYRGEFT